MASQPHSRLLALPPELRTLIWELYCAPGEIETSDVESQDDVSTDAAGPRPSETPRELTFRQIHRPRGEFDHILHICRQIREEVAPIWFSGTLISFSSSKALATALSNADWTVEWWRQVKMKRFGEVTIGGPGNLKRMKWKRLTDTDVLSSIPNLKRLILEIGCLGCRGSKLSPMEGAELLKIVEDVLPDHVWPEVIDVCGHMGVGCATRHWILGRDFQVRFDKREDEYVIGDEWYGEILD